MADSNRTMFVTGAAQGIGRAVAIRGAAAGWSVTATDISPTVEALSHDDRRVLTRQLDVTDKRAVIAAIGEAGPLDALVNCAGIVQVGTILDASDDEVEQGFAVNVRSMIHTIRAALPGMIGRGGGAIVNVASIGSSVKGVPQRFVYGASKGAVIGLTKSVAADFAAQGIRCNAVCPGPIDSPSMRERFAVQADQDAARRAIVARVPMGRLGTSEEVADLVLYLASASFTTGQIHIIDGGITT